MSKLLTAVGMMVLIVLITAVAPAAETLREITWQGQAPAGAKAAASGPGNIEVPNPSGAPLTLPLLTLENPGVTQATHALTGRVRYENVTGPAYLEMWTSYPDGKRFFSRAMAPRGPMGRLQGTSGWRYFSIPFFARGTSQPPSRLELNLVMPGKGTVELGPVALRQFAKGEDPLALPGQWWPGWMGGVIGGLLGVLLGCLGGVTGVLSASGKHRGLVLGLMVAGLIAGLALLAVGVAALVAHQPYAVYYPFLLAGGLVAVLCGGLRPVVQRRYAEFELRRMSAQDTA